MKTNKTYPKTYEEACNTTNTFWNTQPMPNINEFVTTCGRIEPNKQLIELQQLQYNIHNDFIWSTIDFTNQLQLEELTNFLNQYYLNNVSNKFKSYYTPEFIKWVFNNDNISIAIRNKKNNILVGFIGATITLNHFKIETINSADVNFLCVHPKLRNKKMASLLIKELIRRVQLKGCFQGVFMTDRYIPKPIATNKYYHRAIDINHLIKTGFTNVQNNTRVTDIEQAISLPNNPYNKYFAPLCEEDINDVCELLNQYLTKYSFYTLFSEEQFKNIFYNNNIVTTYVLKNIDGDILDMISYYILPYRVNNSDVYIKTAYLFYYTSVNETPYRLIKDIIIVAKQNGIQLFTASNIMENDEVIHDLNFEQGVRSCNYYMYNWKCPNLNTNQIAKIFI